MAVQIRDDGKLSARLVLIGEAGGQHEAAQLKPFVGPSGWRLDEWWRAVGLDRRDFYMTNVYPFQLVRNDLKTVPAAELAHWTDALHDRLAALEGPVVIVPTGNTALRALTGKANIMKHRGSVYAYEDRRGRTIKVIPTIHPAATFRTPEWERRCRRDWERIAGDAAFPELRTPVREHFIRPTLHDVESFVRDAEAADALAVDIETPGRDGRITCIGFAATANFSLTVPTTLSYWQTVERLTQVWALIRRLCAGPAEKVLQQFQFDAFNLLDEGVRLANLRWCTLAMSHCRDSTESHGLAYQASVYTREPYWKDDVKDVDGEGPERIPSMDDWWRYNGKDACVTRELLDVHHAALGRDGRLPFYERHYRSLFGPLLEMMRHGIAMDGPTSVAAKVALLQECAGLRSQLCALAGVPLHRTTKLSKKEVAAGKQPGLSSKKLQVWLYQTLRVPEQRSRQTGRATADEVALKKLMQRYGQRPLEDMTEAERALAVQAALADGPKAQPKGAVSVETGRMLTAVGVRVLRHREQTKVAEFLDARALDPDSRLRASFKFTTATGRLASDKNPRGTGRNVQNIARAVRHAFIPDPGCVFLEVDMSQGEDRIVKMLLSRFAATAARRDELLWRARAKPWENDEHLRAASALFKQDYADLQARYARKEPLVRQWRDLGKRTRHGASYDEGAQTLADVALKEMDLALTAAEASVCLQTIKDADPELALWHGDVRQRVLRDRCLVTGWGRMLLYDYVRLDDDAYRQGYAFEPQSTLVDLVNQYGLVPLRTWRREQGLLDVVKPHVQGHDSILLSTPPQHAYAVLDFLWKSLERPRAYGAEPLTVPVTAKLGMNWSFAEGAGHEFQAKPGEEEVREVLKRWA